MTHYNGITRPSALADAMLRELQENGIDLELPGYGCMILAEGNDIGDYCLNVVPMDELDFDEIRGMEGYGYAIVQNREDVHEYAASQFPDKFYLY